MSREKKLILSRFLWSIQKDIEIFKMEQQLLALLKNKQTKKKPQQPNQTKGS